MEVSRIRALRGPNLWSQHTSIEAVVECAPQESDIARMQGFEDRLRARFPCLPMLQPSGHQDAVALAHVLELTALSLQANAGCPVTFSRTTPTLETGTYQVVVEYTEEDVGRLAFDLAIELCKAAHDDLPSAAQVLARLGLAVTMNPDGGTADSGGTDGRTGSGRDAVLFGALLGTPPAEAARPNAESDQAVEPEAVVAALVAAGVRVRGFATEQASLEDRFVALTGEGFDVVQ